MKVFLLSIIAWLFFTISAGAQISQKSETEENIDSIDRVIKFNIWKLYKPKISADYSITNINRVRNNAQQLFGSSGDFVVLAGAALHYYLEFEKTRSQETLGMWVKLKVELNSKYATSVGSFDLNNDAWLIFENSGSKTFLNHALAWSKSAIELTPESGNWKDTYANILHRLGRTEEAIAVQEKALKLEPSNNDIKSNLEKMKRNEPTWRFSTSSTRAFDKKLSFHSVLKKAKDSKMPIMLDFMATWCGPCLEMERNVYSRKDVSGLLSQNFIAVKLQTDETLSDSQYVKSWHKDVQTLMIKYEIDVLPTLVFLSPENKLVKKVVGGIDADGLISAAKEVLSHYPR